MTSYETVFKRFENKIEDIKVLKLASDDWTELCLEWLNSAIAMIELDQLKIEHDLTKKNDVLFEFEDTLTNGEIEVVALYMVVAWYDIRLNSLEHTNMFYGSKDEKWTSQKEHANYIMSIQKKYKKEARKYFRNHSSRSNSYLDGDQNEV